MIYTLIAIGLTALLVLGYFAHRDAIDKVQAANERANEWRALHDERNEDLAKARADHLADVLNTENHYEAVVDSVKADLEWARVVIATQTAPDMKPTILAEHRAQVIELRGRG